jgi:hypothetical protein
MQRRSLWTRSSRTFRSEPSAPFSGLSTIHRVKAKTPEENGWRPRRQAGTTGARGVGGDGPRRSRARHRGPRRRPSGLRPLGAAAHPDRHSRWRCRRTGTASTRRSAFAVPIRLGGTMTSSPDSMPMASSATTSDAVPLLADTQCRACGERRISARRRQSAVSIRSRCRTRALPSAPPFHQLPIAARPAEPRCRPEQRRSEADWHTQDTFLNSPMSPANRA